MSIHRGLDTDVVHIHTMGCHSVIKKDEVIPSAATWMGLETVTLSEVSQTEKQKHLMTSIM